MKRAITTIAIICSYLTLIATALGCSDSKKDDPSSQLPLSIADTGVAHDGITVGKDATSTYFNVVSGEDVKVTSDATWCKAQAGERTPVNSVTRITLDIEANASNDTRFATVTVSTSGESVKVKVNQGESAGLVVKSVEGIPVAASGGKVKITVTSTGVPVVRSSVSWITTGESRAMTDRTVELSVAANPTSAERRSTVKVELDGLSEEILVTQNAGEEQKGGIGGATPVEIARSMGMGWNLGNQMDAHNNGIANETCWGNPKATPELFVKLKEAGISTVRIPVTWLGKVGDAPAYTIDAAWLDRVAQLVDYAEQAGLNAIVNIHHDGANSAYWLNIKRASTDEAYNASVTSQIKAMWAQVAEKFKSKGSFLMFESFNEIHDGGWGWGDNRKDGGKQYRTLSGWNQAMVDAVRATGGQNATRWIGVPSYTTNADLSYEKDFTLPSDPAGRIMLAIHFYDPYTYTLEAQKSEWGHTGKDVVSGDTGEKNVTSQLSQIKTHWIDKGIPVYFGEMGCVHRSAARAEAFRLYYLEYVTKACHDYGIAPIYWDNGSKGAGRECSGLFDRSTGAFVNNGADVVAVMVKGATSSDPNYTLQKVYDSAPN